MRRLVSCLTPSCLHSALTPPTACPQPLGRTWRKVVVESGAPEPSGPEAEEAPAATTQREQPGAAGAVAAPAPLGGEQQVSTGVRTRSQGRPVQIESVGAGGGGCPARCSVDAWRGGRFCMGGCRGGTAGRELVLLYGHHATHSWLPLPAQPQASRQPSLWRERRWRGRRALRRRSRRQQRRSRGQ